MDLPIIPGQVPDPNENSMVAGSIQDVHLQMNCAGQTTKCLKSCRSLCGLSHTELTDNLERLGSIFVRRVPSIGGECSMSEEVPKVVKSGL